MTRYTFAVAACAALFLPGDTALGRSWIIRSDRIAVTLTQQRNEFGITVLRDPSDANIFFTPKPRLPAAARYEGERESDFTARIQEIIVPLPRGGIAHLYTLWQPEGLQRTLRLEMYPGMPFVRLSVTHQNTGTAPVRIERAELLSLRLRTDAASWRALSVHQWTRPETLHNFDVSEHDIGKSPLRLFTGAFAQHCTWVALRDHKRHFGLVLGWEFNGRATGEFLYDRKNRELQLSVSTDIQYIVQPGQSFTTPPAFVGLFRGDWDDAAYETHRFVRAAIAQPPPDPERFPYVMFDSWAYGQDINEQLLMRAADVAAELGAEVFTVDLGWARNIGDWHPDPVKFPNGLKVFSDYVRGLGMKFGLHWPYVQAHAASPVLAANPDWRASENIDYFGADSLCPAHEPVKRWLIKEGIRMADEYGVDWFLQDGENMVKPCTKTTHTHDAAGSNYAAAAALDEIVRTIQAARPQVRWENCEDGGNMMTYAMARNYATSILDDNDGVHSARQSVWGATFPFPLQYTLRYMADNPPTPYALRSYMMGGPIVLMQRITEWDAKTREVVKNELEFYKRIRPLYQKARVYHHLEQPRRDGKGVDAIQAHDPEAGKGILFVFRGDDARDSIRIYPKGLERNKRYRIAFREDPGIIIEAGSRLMRKGVSIRLPHRFFAEALVITRAE